MCKDHLPKPLYTEALYRIHIVIQYTTEILIERTRAGLDGSAGDDELGSCSKDEGVSLFFYYSKDLFIGRRHIQSDVIRASFQIGEQYSLRDILKGGLRALCDPITNLTKLRFKLGRMIKGVALEKDRVVVQGIVLSQNVIRIRMTFSPHIGKRDHGMRGDTWCVRFVIDQHIVWIMTIIMRYPIGP
jgi:hypothetical protein